MKEIARFLKFKHFIKVVTSLRRKISMLSSFSINKVTGRHKNTVRAVKAYRFGNNPLVVSSSSPSLGDNINGPSVIKVPKWIKNPLGKYYMYFADHQGKYIRLAYCDSLDGPWKIYEPGTLHIQQVKLFKDHIASPDVHVDENKQEVQMYFHGLTIDGSQKTGIASSQDGLRFTASNDILGEFYFRVFKWKGFYYAVAKAGNTGWGALYRSKDGITAFERRKRPFLKMMRHAAVLLKDDKLLVFYSRKGDAPERIVMATVELAKDWLKWQESEPIDILFPDQSYEGSIYPNKPSSYGSAIKVRELRDPCVFVDNERIYLFYTIAGEMGIAAAEIKIEI